MGNTNSVPNNKNINIINTSKNIPKIELDQNIIFENILKISNEMITRYQNNYLEPTFCDNMALIYQNKLNELDIKVLRNIHNNINNSNNKKGNTEQELRLLLQYNPKNDETFFTDSFKVKLQEVFWGKNIDYSKDIFDSKDLPENFDTFISYIKYKPRYINPKHVNKLLETIPSTNLSQKGGDYIKNYSNNLNKQLNKINTTKKYNNKVSLSNFTNESNNNESNNNELNNNEPNNNEPNNNKINRQNKQVNSLNKQVNSLNKQVNNNRQNKQVSNITNKNTVIENKNITHNTTIPKQYNKQYQKPFNKQFQKSFNKQLSKFPPNKVPYNKNVNKTLEKTTNKIILKYFVPGWYKTPSDICENSESCSLTKKQLCKAITENFIVRNNIIAAILTAIPEKVTYSDGRVEYIGGICYEKFINLNECKMCVPFNYKELIGKDIQDIIQNIIQKSEYLTEIACREHGGYFLKLTDNEKKIFGSKIYYNNSNKKLYPKTKYNLFYVECLEKLKTSYFTSLNNLILILEKMNVNAYIDNDTMNKIAMKTKEILDNMYSLCNYYYVYAIIALINGDFSVPVTNNTKSLSSSFESALKTPKK